MSAETDATRALVDLPIWMLVLVALAGLVGEMRQADVSGVAMGEIVRRVLLRFGSSALFGMVALMMSLWAWGDPYLAGAFGIGTGLIGADVAGGIYSRWLAKRAGVEPPGRAE